MIRNKKTKKLTKLMELWSLVRDPLLTISAAKKDVGLFILWLLLLLLTLLNFSKLEENSILRPNDPLSGRLSVVWEREGSIVEIFSIRIIFFFLLFAIVTHELFLGWRW
jgi:hypothetical protein